MSRGDVFDDPCDIRADDSLQTTLKKVTSVKLAPDTSYETLSNIVIKIVKLFSSEVKRFDADTHQLNDAQTFSNIQTFCKFVEGSLNELQVRLSRKAFDFCLCQIVKWMKVCPAWLLNDLFHALGAVVYGAGTMSDQHREVLLTGPSAVLKKFLDVQYPDADIQRLAYQCLANLCIRCDRGLVHEETQTAVLGYLLKCLTRAKSPKIDDVSHLRLVVISFDGITSLAQYSKCEVTENLALIFAAIRYYMVLGLPGFYDLPVRPFDPIKNTSIMNKLSASSAQQTAFNQKLFGLKMKRKKSSDGDSDFESDEDEMTDPVIEKLPNTDGDTKPDYVDIRELIGSHKSEFSLIAESKQTDRLPSYSKYSPGRDISKLAGVCKKVRTVALNCLLEVLKFSPAKLTFGYWWHFIPDESISEFIPSQQPFFYLLLKDRNVKSKTQALSCLSQFLVLARPYILAAADDRHDPKAYTSYSYTLAASVKELHRVLVQITSLDFGFVTLPVALQALNDLILSTPYHKLRFGLLTRLVRHLVNFLNSSHCQTRMEAIKCLAAVTLIDPPLAEVYELFKNATPPSRAPLLSESEDSPANSRFIRSGAQTPLTSYGLYGTSSSSSLTGSFSNIQLNTTSSADSGVKEVSDEASDRPEEGTKGVFSCWAMSIMMDIILNGHPITKESAYPDQDALRIVALTFVASLSQHYFQVLLPNIDSLLHIVDVGLSEERSHSSEVKVAVLSMLEKVARAMTKSTHHLSDDKLLSFWKHVLDGALTKLLKPRNKSGVRSVACDCLAAIPPVVYESLPHEQKMHCVSLMIGYSTENGDHSVAGAALRALGSYIQFLPSLKTDYTFIVDVSKAIFSLISHSNRYVRSRASWTLANLSDNFISLSDNDPDFLLELSTGIFCQCLQACIESTGDQDRCKYNAVRGIGSLLYCVNTQLLDEEPGFDQLLKTAFDALNSLVSGPCLAKVRWNACYAAGLVLQNQLLFERMNQTLIRPLQVSLISTIDSCKNFKVKINAVTALQSMKSRAQYGDRFVRCVTLGLTALVDSQTLANFDEYKHQAELQDCLCVWMCKLMLLMKSEDIAQVVTVFGDSNLTASSLQLFQICASKDSNLQLFEKVCSHLRELPKDEQSSCAVILKVFTLKASLVVSPYASAETPPAAVFKD